MATSPDNAFANSTKTPAAVAYMCDYFVVTNGDNLYTGMIHFLEFFSSPAASSYTARLLNGHKRPLYTDMHTYSHMHRMFSSLYPPCIYFTTSVARFLPAVMRDMRASVDLIGVDFVSHYDANAGSSYAPGR